MKAYEIQQSFGIDHLAPSERPDPRPGPGQVLIKMRALSLNYRDLLVVKGLYNPKLRRPMIPVSDGVGDIVAVGEGVTSVKPGERVAGTFMQQWVAGGVTEAAAKTALGGAFDGLLAEYAVLHENGVVRPPAHLTDEEASTLPCAALTAWHGLIRAGRLRPGESVLVQGTGGVSIFALQFAHLGGARVIITSSSDQKLERARQLGASDGINYKETPDWEDRVRQLNGGAGVDHIVEVGGAGTLGKSLKAVRSGGRIYLIGVLAGPANFNPTPLLMKNVRLQGIFVGSRDMFEAMNRAITLCQLRPVIDRTFGFDDIQAALRHMESGAHFGKVCVRAG